jgi:hypothetical protein
VLYVDAAASQRLTRVHGERDHQRRTLVRTFRGAGQGGVSSRDLVSSIDEPIGARRTSNFARLERAVSSILELMPQSENSSRKAGELARCVRGGALTHMREELRRGFKWSEGATDKGIEKMR